MGKHHDKGPWTLSLAFTGLLALCSLFLLEAILYLPVIDRKFQKFFRTAPPTSLNFEQEATEIFRNQRFDAELGWDKRPPVSNFSEGKAYLAQAYGDSFTESGHETITWQAAFEEITGQGILNFGKGGYSLGQALVKFEKYGSDYPTPVAILGVYNKMFPRDLSYYLYYYSRKPRWKFVFRPIFVKEGDGYKLFEPPCEEASCLRAVFQNADSETMRVLTSHDYWYRQNLEKPKLRFPRILSYMNAVPIIWRDRKDLTQENYFFVNNQSFELTKYLIQRFVAHAQHHGMIPVCLLLYQSRDLVVMKKGKRWDEGLLEFFEKEEIRYVDSGSYILKNYAEDDDFNSLRVPDYHLNDRGDRLVAAALAEGFAKMGLLQESSK